MRHATLRLLLPATLLAVLSMAVWNSSVTACGPFVLRAAFVLESHPDLPLDAFAAGDLGIVAGTWARSQLFVAYRHLSGVPLTNDERAGVLALWAARLHPVLKGNEATKAWLRARGNVPGVGAAPGIDVFRAMPGDTFSSYLNCPDDAFATAARTLSQRIEQFGAASDAVAEWLRAQDLVFANCGAAEPAGASPALPGVARATLPPIVRADREYQVASALFYAGRFEDAGRGFEAIGRDPNSPWRSSGRYLQARALVRRATVDGDRASLPRAEALLRQLLEEGNRLPAVRRLLAFVRARTAPLDRIRELDASLRQPSGTDIERELDDYTLLLDRVLEPDDSPQLASGPDLRARLLSAAAGSDDLTDWILTFQRLRPNAPGHGLGRWKQTRSQPWLAAAISLAGARDEGTESLLAAAREVAPASPAYATVAYHAARLLVETGRNDDARALVDALLPRARKGWPPSALNAILAQRSALARGLAEFVSFSLRQPSLLTFDIDSRELPEEVERLAPGRPAPVVPAKQVTPVLLADDAADILNQHLPLRQVVEVVESGPLPEAWQEAVGRAAWARAVLLDARALGERAAKVVLSKGRSEAAPSLATELRAYLTAPTPADRRFTAVLAMLRNPGATPYVRGGMPRETPFDQIDNYRQNWWCAVSGADDRSGSDGLFPPAPMRAEARTEREVLRAAGTAPNYLARQVLDYARSHTADPRVPEALALAVKATRFGCGDADTTTWSRAAFTLLHRRYPNSSWAKATRYYY